MLRTLAAILLCVFIGACSFNGKTASEASSNQNSESTESIKEKDEAKIERVVSDRTDEFGIALLKALFDGTDIEFASKEMGSTKDSQSALEDGAIDVMTGVSDDLEDAEEKTISMTYSYYYDADNDDYWVFTVKSENENVLKILNTKLLEARESGTYQKVYDQFFEDDTHSVLIDHDKDKDSESASEKKDEKSAEESKKEAKQTSTNKESESTKSPTESNPESINPDGVKVVNGQFSVAGITLGTSLQQVKNKLGKPTYDGPDTGEMQSYDHVTEYGPLFIGYNRDIVTGMTFDVKYNVRTTSWFKQLPNSTTEGDGNYFYLEGTNNYFKVEPFDNPYYAYIAYAGPEFESEKERKEREKNKLTPDEAIQAVIDRENLDEYPQVIVEHDHDEDERYVIHVYEIVGEGTEESHTATWGWYYVDPYSGNITSMFD